MTTSENFNPNAKNTQAMLEKYDKAFSGQLIEIAMGESALKDMFEAHPEYQEDKYDGMPSMKIAQQLDIISAKGADALLILQAGASMVRNAQRMTAVRKGEEVETRKIDKHSVDFMNGDVFDARFKALKFGGEPDVVDAQVSYAISQVALNELAGYVLALKKVKNNPNASPDAESNIKHRIDMHDGAEEIFAKYGAELIAKAAATLAQEDKLQPKVASNLQELSQHAMPKDAQNIQGSPVDFAFADIEDAIDAAYNEYNAIGGHHIAEPSLMYFIAEHAAKDQNPTKRTPAVFPPR